MTNAFSIIRGGVLVDPQRRAAAPTDILIEGDTIASIGPPGLEAPPDAALIDASDRALMPGLVNAHVHGHGTLAKGLVGDRWPLEVFLNGMPGMTGHRTVEDKYLNGLLAAVEMIRKGCTACYDLFFEFPIPSREGVAALGQAYRDAGMRAVIAPMLADKTLYQAYPGLIEAMPEALRTDVRAFTLAPYEATADAVEKIFADWPFDRDWIRPAIAPTIPLHCSDAFLDPLPRSGARLRSAAANPSRREQGAGGSRLTEIRQDADRASGNARPARSALFCRARNLAR